MMNEAMTEPNYRQRFTLYHSNEDAFREALMEVDLPFETSYHIVATVEAECLGHVYQLTNHIESNWTDNAEVLELFTPKNRTRSTSVGDIIVDERGQGWRVLGMGFAPVTVRTSAAR